jgi:hypothetical protein
MSMIERTAARRPDRRAFNLRTLFALLLTAAALCGCARYYDMTLTNGGRVEGVRQPKLDRQGGSWTYITRDGKTNLISASRVINIVPHGEKN